jgi:Protein kinase domain
VGAYQLTARLGAGGMGVVYLGEAADGSLVAVKVLRPELADDPEFRARFSREVAALAQVRGVCTVRMIEADTMSASPFMVTEYAAGPSLSEYVAEHGPVGADMLYGLATGLAEALTAIHAAGVVHRDLKPSNVILGRDGPKVIDFGIAQALDATGLTQTGMMVGSAGFMAPEQVTGRAGHEADVFSWAVTLAYAASGQMPFGTGLSDAILYRVLHAEPDIAAVPALLRPLVTAALAKDPRGRPGARDLLEQLAHPARPGRGYDARTQAVLARTWPGTEPSPARPLRAGGSLLVEPATADARRPRTGRPGARWRSPARGRLATLAVPAAATIAVALALAMLTGRIPTFGLLTANQGSQGTSPAAFAVYPGQQQRGVVQSIGRIVASGTTIVAMGSQVSDGVTRQQFFVSTNSGATWRLAPVRAPGGGQPPLGYPAARLAGGPGGWLAVGPQAIWTSPDGTAWTLAATHGITPQQPGDQMTVLTNVSGGFLAAGQAETAGGGTQAVVWTSRDGLAWQRHTAAQLGLAGPGETVTSISYAVSRGDDTVISGAVADGGTTYSGVWLTTDGGSAWTRVNVPADHGASSSVTGLGADGSGLIAVRPGRSASGAPDGVVYFSPNGQGWQYAATIDAAGGWTPNLVKGSDYGFVVSGTTAAGRIVAYTSTGTGTAWQATAPLGAVASQTVDGATIGARGTVIAVGSTSASRTGQQPVFEEATAAGRVSKIPLSGIPGAIVPELAVNSLAVAGGEQIAVGSADGYPAVWRRAAGSGSWTLVSSPSLAAADPGLAALTSVTHGPAGWLAVGTPGPVVLTSLDGTTWRRAAGPITKDLAGMSAAAVAADPAGYVIVGQPAQPDGDGGGDAWWSPDLTTWTRGTDMNDMTGPSQMLAVAADGHGFMVVGSHDGHPAVWATTDGLTWTTIVLGLPAGASAADLDLVAINAANRVVALGLQHEGGHDRPLAEVSADGGASWQQVASGLTGAGALVTALTASTGGFTAATRSGAAGQRAAAVWISATGASWIPVPVSGLTGTGSHDITTLAPSGTSVAGIDLVQTQASQRYGLLLRGP